MSISVWIPGHPAPQGSKRHVGKGILVESSKAVAPWREDMRWRLLALSAPERAAWPVDGPISVLLNFVLPRPKSTPKSRTPAAVKKPDLDKLARAALDAIGSAGVYRDDAQVTELHATKRLAARDEASGLHITVHVAHDRAEVAS